MMMSRVIGLTLILGILLSNVHAQTDSCYTDLMRAGNVAMVSRDWENAIKLYEAARRCLNLKDTQFETAGDSINMAFYRSKVELQTEKEKAESFAAEVVEVNQSLEDKQDSLEQANEEINRAKAQSDEQTKVAESYMLALRSSQAVEDDDPITAIELAQLAVIPWDDLYDSLHDTMRVQRTVRRSFSSAAFAHFKCELSSHGGNIIGIDFYSEADLLFLRLDDGRLLPYQYFYYDTKYQDEGVTRSRFTAKYPAPGFREAPDFRENYVSDVALTEPSGEQFVTAHRRGTMQFLSVDDSSATGRFRDDEQLTKLQFSVDDSMIIAAHRSGKISMHDLTSTAPFGTYTSVQPHEAPVIHTEISPASRIGLSFAHDKKCALALWDYNGTVLDSQNSEGLITTASFYNRGRNYLFSDTKGYLALCAASGSVEPNRISAHRGAIVQALVHQDNRIITCGTDGAIKLYDGIDGSLIFETIIDEPVLNAKLSHESNVLCVLSRQKIRYYRVTSNRIQLMSSAAFQQPIINQTMALSNDGIYAITVGNNHSVNLWHQDGSLLLNTPPFESHIWEVGFTPNQNGFWAFANESAWLNTLPHHVYNVLHNENPFSEEELMKKHEISQQTIDALKN